MMSLGQEIVCIWNFKFLMTIKQLCSWKVILAFMIMKSMTKAIFVYILTWGNKESLIRFLLKIGRASCRERVKMSEAGVWLWGTMTQTRIRTCHDADRRD